MQSTKYLAYILIFLRSTKKTCKKLFYSGKVSCHSRIKGALKIPYNIKEYVMGPPGLEPGTNGL